MKNYVEDQFQKWLFNKYLIWVEKRGKPGSISSFADEIGVSRSVMSQWLNGNRLPNMKSLVLLADKLGPEIYTLIGESDFDPEIVYVASRWKSLSKTKKQEIIKIIEKSNKNR